jgi:hypothetical protein
MNTAEKNHQIRLMKSLYKNAKQVIVWPGPLAGDRDFVMERTRMISLHFNGRSVERTPDTVVKSFRIGDIYGQNPHQQHSTQDFRLLCQVYSIGHGGLEFG